MKNPSHAMKVRYFLGCTIVGSRFVYLGLIRQQESHALELPNEDLGVSGLGQGCAVLHSDLCERQRRLSLAEPGTQICP